MGKQPLVYVIDDDASMAGSISSALVYEGYATKVFHDAETALRAIRETYPDLIISDIRLPGINGIELVSEISELHRNLPIILTTAYGSTDMAIEATSAGAYDFIEKPFELSTLLKLVSKASTSYQLAKTRVALEPTRETRDKSIIGESKAMRDICKLIGRAAKTQISILIRGETGTGKELVAQALFHYSDRSNKPFLAVNCLAIPQDLIESELFGHERGAFTGAHSRRIGRFEQVRNGTLFLDEIGDLPMSTQGKLLRVLQEGVIQRVGNNIDIPIHTRIITATHRNLEDAIQNGSFRQDLYYRLSAQEIWIPPLRERPEDILPLIHYFLERYSHQIGTTVPDLTQSASQQLEQYSWPGNVRELQNLVQKMLIECRGLAVTREIVNSCLPTTPPNSSHSDPDSITHWILNRLNNAGENLLENMRREMEAEIIKNAIKLTHGNKKQLATLLGCSRPTIYQKLREHGFHQTKSDQE